jgi:peptidoglycan/LPS O-acetylase OafA/YrhL
MWSLATEVAFYLLLPAIMWVALSRRKDGRASRNTVVAVVAVLVVVNGLWMLDLAGRFDGISPLSRLWLPSYLTWFGVGIVLAHYHVRLQRPGGDGVGPGTVASLLQQMGRTPGVCWTAALAIFAIAATPLAGPASLTAPTMGEALTKNLLYAAVAALLILPCVFAPPEGRFMRTMSRPPLRHVGHLSYGVFCIHLTVLELVARSRHMVLFQGRTFELFALTLAISLIVSEGLYRFVERPAMRLRNVPRPGRTRSVDTSKPNAAATRS